MPSKPSGFQLPFQKVKRKTHSSKRGEEFTIRFRGGEFDGRTQQWPAGRINPLLINKAGFERTGHPEPLFRRLDQIYRASIQFKTKFGDEIEYTFDPTARADGPEPYDPLKKPKLVPRAIDLLSGR